jgi:glutamyl-tRNA(Gln) amidotransferase subunit E
LTFGEGKGVGVQSLTVEEDAARVLGEDDGSRHYGLDRLGVPLVEIALDPIPDSAEDVESAALQLGRVLRSTGRVARGLGTIRQDLNVSVMDGAVVEVKGVQKLNLIAKVVRYEAARQLGMIRVAEEAKIRLPGALRCEIKDVTEVLSRTNSAVLRRVLGVKGSRVYCITAPGLAGLLGFEPFPSIRLGRELGEIARSNSLGGVIHSDEFEKQGVSSAEAADLRRIIGADEKAALVLVGGEVERAWTVALLVKERLEAVTEGVLRETRAATEAGETRYLRPRPGAARMYPETDIPDIVIAPEWAAELRTQLPISWEAAVRTISEKYSLSGELALQLYDAESVTLFESLAKRLRLEPSVIGSTLVEAPARLSREGIDEARLTDELLSSLLEALSAGEFAKERSYDVLRSVAKGEAATVVEAARRLGITPIDDAELEIIVDRVVQKNSSLILERGDRAFSVLMGEVMEVARGKVDGAKVSTMIRSKMKEAQAASGSGR